MDKRVADRIAAAAKEIADDAYNCLDRASFHIMVTAKAAVVITALVADLQRAESARKIVELTEADREIGEARGVTMQAASLNGEWICNIHGKMYIVIGIPGGVRCTGCPDGHQSLTLLNAQINAAGAKG